MGGSEPLRLVGVELVVPPHDDLRAERAEQVREVVRERVVVVDQEDHGAASCSDSASSIAASSARSLARHSSCSAAGSESATMPPPACRCATPSRSHERADRDARVELARLRQEVADRARVDAAPVLLELRDDLHRAHLRRARDGAGREGRAQQLERRDPVAQLPDDLRDEMRHVRVALGLHEALDPHRPRHADAGEVVAPEVDEHRVLGAVLLRREQGRRVAFAGRDRPGDRVQLGAAAGALDDRLRRAAHERDVAELQEEEVRRRVDAPQRPVELDGRRRGRAGRALRDHDLEDVALADVLLRALDAAEVLVARRLALERPARRRAAGQRRRRAGRARLRRRAAARRRRARGRSGAGRRGRGRGSPARPARPPAAARSARSRRPRRSRGSRRPARRASPPPRRRRAATRRRRSCSARAARARPTRAGTSRRRSHAA